MTRDELEHIIRASADLFMSKAAAGRGKDREFCMATTCRMREIA